MSYNRERLRYFDIAIARNALEPVKMLRMLQSVATYEMTARGKIKIPSSIYTLIYTDNNYVKK